MGASILDNFRMTCFMDKASFDGLITPNIKDSLNMERRMEVVFKYSLIRKSTKVLF